MSKIKITLQPGPVFYDVFHGFLRIAGTGPKHWSLSHGLHGNNVKAAATGVWNGPGARDLRQKMIEWVGAELFERLLAELPPSERAELLVKVRDLRALTTARNLLTSEIEDLVLGQYGALE